MDLIVHTIEERIIAERRRWSGHRFVAIAHCAPMRVSSTHAFLPPDECPAPSITRLAATSGVSQTPQNSCINEQRPPLRAI
jgi:hypothetical protein